ncbi:MAG: GldG family protein [Candidatus Competibacteraceae bacterium]|nr:GldG family protein [Candidatus Competibacteraceae bacterium]
MRLDRSTRRRLWFQNLLFYLLFGVAIGLLAWSSTRYEIQFDWSAGNRNTLSEASRTVLAGLDGPVRVTAYARDNPALRDAITRLMDRYQRHKPDVTLSFVNPDLLPDRVRELEITRDGELYLEYRGRGEKAHHLGEQAVTHALQRLSRQTERVLLFLDGHGERKPLGTANHDLGAFGRELAKTGIQARPLDLAVEARIPPAAALVIAGPRAPLSPEASEAILEFLERGGNLLWLLEPGESSGLHRLAAVLGVTARPGIVVDPDAQRLGIRNPTFIPIADYGPHPITESLRAPALLPQATALEVRPLALWAAAVLLECPPRSWAETGPIDIPLRFAPDRAEPSDPLTVGVALFRPSPVEPPDASDPRAGAQQRVVVIGDGDFLSNTYLGNGANLELGSNIVNWLLGDDALIAIPPRTAPDPHLHLSEGTLALLAAGFLIGAPGALLASGWLIWFRRRRR